MQEQEQKRTHIGRNLGIVGILIVLLVLLVLTQQFVSDRDATPDEEAATSSQTTATPSPPVIRSVSGSIVSIADGVITIDAVQQVAGDETKRMTLTLAVDGVIYDTQVPAETSVTSEDAPQIVRTQIGLDGLVVGDTISAISDQAIGDADAVTVTIIERTRIQSNE